MQASGTLEAVTLQCYVHAHWIAALGGYAALVARLQNFYKRVWRVSGLSVVAITPFHHPASTCSAVMSVASVNVNWIPSVNTLPGITPATTMDSP